MLNPNFVRAHFALHHDVLYRILADGTLRPLSLVIAGKLMVKVAGKLYSGPEIAWTLVYGTPPMFPIALLGLPTEMIEENLVPIRGRRLIFRFTEGPRGYSHRLNPAAAFRSVPECRDDWIAHARRYYAADVTWAVQQERLRDRDIQYPEYSRPAAALRKRTVAAASTRPPRPAPVTGKLHYFYEGQWVMVPPACHPADDHKERCRHVLAGATSFRYDKSVQRVVPVFDQQ